MTSTGHLVIAGTGRAGTSFLVRLLNVAGLDTGEDLEDSYHPEVRAGYERRFEGDDLPRVVKDPWLWTYVDKVDPRRIARLIVPVRDLRQVASSRLRNEWRGVPLAFAGTETFGRVPGGAVYDLSIRGQEDMAARGFYILVQWAVESGVPLAFLDFRTLFEDPNHVPDMLHHDLNAQERDLVRAAWHIVKESTS